MKISSGAKDWVTLFARLILGGVLILAGVLKAKAPYEAAAAVRAYQLLPNSFASILGHSLPWLEIGAGLDGALHRRDLASLGSRSLD